MTIRFFMGSLLLCVGMTLSCRQSNKGGAEPIAPYLGQTLPGAVPELFAPGIISTPDHEHSPMVISPDGRQIIWARMPVPLGSGRQDLFEVHWDNGRWSAPLRLPFTVENRCGSPVLAPDGQSLYYVETIRDSTGRTSMLWRARRTANFGWGERQRVTGLLPETIGRVCMRFGFADNGNLYYDWGGPTADGSWAWEIWMRLFCDGHYQDPVKLGGGINDGNINWTPFVAPDESYLIFSSDRMANGDVGDHYISFRGRNGRWSKPLSMGETVNTPRQERFPVVSPDGRYLFFARHMPEKYNEIFWMQAGLIDSLRTLAEL